MNKQVDFINEYNARIAAILRPATHLIEYAENPPREDSPQIKDDILRAAVVFLHAALEDFLRYIGSKFIPRSKSEEVLNKISLIGGSDVLRPEKFFLGKLAKHRGKTVDKLIAESVEAHYDRRSFSNTNEISELLKGAGVPIKVVEKLYPSLRELMDRRHNIVHEGDLKPNANRHGEREPEAIEATKVREWYDTIERFTGEVAACKLGAGL